MRGKPNYTSKEFWKPFGKVSVFIDAANVFYSQNSLGWTIDFKKFFSFFNEISNKFMGVSFYFALWFKKNDKRKNEERMIEMLKRVGYRVVIKDSKRVKGHIKANCDVELTIDSIRLMGSYDTCVLLSGDGDFAALCKYLKGHGKKVIVVSYRGHISYELIDNCDLYISLDKFSKVIKYSKGKKHG